MKTAIARHHARRYVSPSRAKARAERLLIAGAIVLAAFAVVGLYAGMYAGHLNYVAQYQ